MGEIFLANSGKRSFQMFWYECPITKRRRKKQVEITKKLPAAAAYSKAEKLQKELERSIDDGNYTAEDKPFGMALGKIKDKHGDGFGLARIYQQKWELHQKDPTTGLRERTYNEYIGFLNIIRGTSNHQIKIFGKKLSDYKCSEITPIIANEVSKVFVKQLNKNFNTKCWAKFDTACKLAITEGMGMKIDPTLTIKRELHQSKQRKKKIIAPSKSQIDPFLDHLEEVKNKGSNSCPRKDYTSKFNYIINLYSNHTGKRSNEIYGTRIQDVNLDKGYVEVNQVLCAKTGNIELTKTDKSERIVALSDRLIKGLQEWLAYLKNKNIPNPHLILFPAMNGSYRNASNVLNRNIKKPAKDFGLDPSMFSVHQYRRHNNSRRKEAGHDGDRLRNQMGHEDEKMTKLYNTTWEDIKKDREDINQAFKN